MDNKFRPYFLGIDFFIADLSNLGAILGYYIERVVVSFRVDERQK